MTSALLPGTCCEASSSETEASTVSLCTAFLYCVHLSASPLWQLSESACGAGVVPRDMQLPGCSCVQYGPQCHVTSRILLCLHAWWLGAAQRSVACLNRQAKPPCCVASSLWRCQAVRRHSNHSLQAPTRATLPTLYSCLHNSQRACCSFVTSILLSTRYAIFKTGYVYR
jgi:hypothetical protein